MTFYYGLLMIWGCEYHGCWVSCFGELRIIYWRLNLRNRWYIENLRGTILWAPKVLIFEEFICNWIALEAKDFNEHDCAKHMCLEKFSSKLFLESFIWSLVIKVVEYKKVAWVASKSNITLNVVFVKEMTLKKLIKFSIYLLLSY